MYIFNLLSWELESFSESDLRINYFCIEPVQRAAEEIIIGNIEFRI